MTAVILGDTTLFCILSSGVFVASQVIPLMSSLIYQDSELLMLHSPRFLLMSWLCHLDLTWWSLTTTLGLSSELTVCGNTQEAITAAQSWKANKTEYLGIVSDLYRLGWIANYGTIEIGALGHYNPSAPPTLQHILLWISPP